MRGSRTSPRRFETTVRERWYLHNYWPLLRELRDALRTEPNVRLGVLFGSTATGRAHAASDIDIVVSLADSSMGRIADLSSRLAARLGRDVQLVRLEDARQAPQLMRALTTQGRVLVDRDGEWPAIVEEAPRWLVRAHRAEKRDALAAYTAAFTEQASRRS